MCIGTHGICHCKQLFDVSSLELADTQYMATGKLHDMRSTASLLTNAIGWRRFANPRRSPLSTR
jgi:hypothetical protein